MKSFLKKVIFQFSRLFTWSIENDIRELKREVVSLKKIRIDEYIREYLFKDPRYEDPKKLTRYEYQVYSQNGEDGILEEIFRRIGTTNKFFVEFGVDRLECNTLLLLLKRWRGCWIEANSSYVRFLREKLQHQIGAGALTIKESFITAENVEELFESLSVPKELDLLSIDIDGNDYWVWKAIQKFSPRVVLIEYNAMFPANLEFIMSYEAKRKYAGGGHFGASLKSLEKLGKAKGYTLVGCNFLGVNAFFVRDDLVADKFAAPFTAEHHYEPPRYPLVEEVVGHRRNFGPFETDEPS